MGLKMYCNKFIEVFNTLFLTCKLNHVAWALNVAFNTIAYSQVLQCKMQAKLVKPEHHVWSVICNASLTCEPMCSCI